MLRSCSCSTPHPSSDPRRENECVICSGQVLPEWSSANVADAFDRLKAIPELKASNTFEAFRDMCLARELAGRDHFGYRFHGRDNIRDGLEEACDGANYAAMDVIAAHRRGEQDAEDVMALTAAWRFYQAYDALIELRNKRGGAP